jgi:hypothetical protein
MTASVAFAHVANGTAYVTVTVNGAPVVEVRDLAKSAFLGLGVEYDGLANSARSGYLGNYFTASQKVGDK